MNVSKAIIFGDVHRVPSLVDLLTCASRERAFMYIRWFPVALPFANYALTRTEL